MENNPSRTIENPEKIFSKLYPHGTYREIPLAEIPKEIGEKLEFIALVHSLDSETKLKNIRYFHISLDDGSSAYGARFDNEYTEFSHSEGDKDIYRIRLTEPSFYFLQLDSAGKNLGNGAVRYFFDSIRTKDNFPIVDYVETPHAIRKQGIGTERYRLMSALSRFFFGKNLYSSFAISPEAESVWKKFCAKKEAEVVDEYEDEEGKVHFRYRLLTPV